MLVESNHCVLDLRRKTHDGAHLFLLYTMDTAGAASSLRTQLQIQVKPSGIYEASSTILHVERQR